MTKYGYARVSTDKQTLNRQLDALEKEGIQLEYIYMEKQSGMKRKRQELSKMLDALKEGDEIIVTDLTRISRSSKDLYELIEVITKKGANLKSLKDTWLDTSGKNAMSEFLLKIMAAVNQLERDLISERVKEGVHAAKKRGKYAGRPKKYSDKNSGMNYALKLYEEGEMTVKQICEITKVSRSSLYEMAKERSIARV